MTFTRQSLCWSLAIGLLVSSAAIQAQRLSGQEPKEFEVLTGRVVPSSSGAVPEMSSPGNQLNGLSMRRRRIRTVSHPNVAQLETSGTYVPSRFRRTAVQQIDGTPVIQGGPHNTVYEGVMEEMPMKGGAPCADGSCGMGDCGVDACGCGDANCGNYGFIPCPRFSLKNMQFMFGAHGFLSPRDMNTARLPGGFRHDNQSFGFHGGVNWGFYLPCTSKSFALQLGTLITKSNYDGSAVTTNKRDQVFLTGGIFRRVDWGLQGGLVVDYLNDRWYADHQLIQLRGEISWVFPNSFEFGFNFAGSTRLDTSVATYNAAPGIVLNETREALDNYRFFCRQRFQRGGEGRIFAGWTEDADGLLGADMILPINCNWAVQGGFTYVIPQNDAIQNPPLNYDYDNELWNINVSIVWFPGGFDNLMHRYNRPLFNVADNGSLLQKIVP